MVRKEERQLNRYPEFEPIPFYFYNDVFDSEEILLQLDEMKHSGITAFFLHVRDGNTEESYGTDLFFKRVKFIIEQAKKRGIKVWLYDEDSYPSGNCGGKIAIENPELIANALKVIKIHNDGSGVLKKVLGRVKGLFGYIVDKNTKENQKVLIDCFGPIRRNWYKVIEDRVYVNDLEDLHYKMFRGETNYTEIIFEAEVPKDVDVYVAYLEPLNVDERFGAYVDCLNEKTADMFIQSTHEKYKRYLGEYFGTQIPGIFLDEPNVGGILPFTEELFEYFYNKYSYRLENNLFKLSKDYDGDGEKFIKDYLKACTELFNKNFIGKIKDWCVKNGLILTGHFGGEESLGYQTISGQNIYRNLRAMDVQGFDVITYNIGSKERPRLLAGANISVSAAIHENKEKVLAECFALYPYDAGYVLLKRTSDWLFVNGINKLVPHAFHYGYSAFQRADAGKSYFFQDANFGEYKAFAGYVGRSCKLLLDYQRKNDVLVVIPYESVLERILRNNCQESIAPEEDYFRFISLAAEKHLGVDSVDLKAIYDARITDSGEVIVGGGCYKTVYFIGSSEEELNCKKFLTEKGVKACVFDKESKLENPDDLLFGDVSDLLAYRKYNENGEMLFLMNNSKKYHRFSIKANYNVYVYDAENDVTMKMLVDNGRVEVALNAFQSLFVLFDKTDRKCEEIYKIPTEKKYKKEDYEDFDLIYKPVGMRTAVVEWKLVTEKNGKKTFDGDVEWCRLRDALGTQDKIYKDRYKVPFYDRAKRQEDIYPQRAVFTSKVHCFNEKDYVLFDKGTFSGDYKIFFNGEQINKEQLYKKRVYDRSNTAFNPKWKNGENVIEIIFDEGGEFDGINGELYVMRND